MTKTDAQNDLGSTAGTGPLPASPAAAVPQLPWIVRQRGDSVHLFHGHRDAPSIVAKASHVARCLNAHDDLVSIAKRWAALDGGAWTVDRHAADKAQLLADTRAALALAEPSST